MVARYKTSGFRHCKVRCKMKGFDSPTFTMIPNDFFALAPDMSLSELQILLYLMRETFGWHRPQTTITIRQLARSTGLSTRSIVDGAVKLEERGLLRRIVQPNKVTVWECVVESSTSALYFSQHRVVPRKVQVPVKESKEIEIKKNEDEERIAEIGKVYKTYQSEIGVITPMIADSIDGWIKDGLPLKWLCDAFQESSAQGKRSWKYCEAIIKRWDAQGHQEAMEKPQGKPNTYKPRDLIQERYGGIMEWAKEMQENENKLSGIDGNHGKSGGGVPQLEAR